MPRFFLMLNTGKFHLRNYLRFEHSGISGQSKFSKELKTNKPFNAIIVCRENTAEL
jgi:hypothetical protein